jgi:peptidyl-prolyl cis-trans isomerase B (cyclophilin B)
LKREYSRHLSKDCAPRKLAVTQHETMKKIFLTVPILAILAGCSTPSQSEVGSNAAANDTTATNATGTVVTDADVKNAVATAKKENQASAAAPAASTRAYGIDTDIPADFPADAAAALKKAQVPPPPASMKIAAKTRVQLVTTKGKIVVEVDGKAAPLQAKSFVYLAGRKFYDGVTFHRYEPGFVIQGGDPLSKDKALVKKYESAGLIGAGGPGYTVPRETNNLKHVPMVIAAARTSDPDSAGSQFYFTLASANFLDQDQAQDGFGYVVFGKVLSGKDVVAKLRAGDEIKSATVLK